MKQVFQPEWRTQNRLKRRFYTKYMTWLERMGYLVVACVIAAFLFAFNYPVDDVISAEGVKLMPAATPVTASSRAIIVRRFKNDLDEVKKGDPLVEVVDGDPGLQTFQRWQEVEALQADVGHSPDLDRLAAKYPKPRTQILTAPASGTLRLDPKISEFDSGAEICRVVDYNDVRLDANLAGDSVARAKVGQWAKISNIEIGGDSGTVFRASSPAGPLLSTQLLQKSLRRDLSARLKGMAVQFRDDVPLKIDDVTEIQVDTSVDRTAGSSTQTPAPLAPPQNYVLRAQVLEGKPAASAQVADLPADLRNQLDEQIKGALRANSIRDLNGQTANLQDVGNPQILLQLKAQDLAPADSPTLRGTPLKRTFNAGLKIDSPPAFLIQALRDADRSGKDVTVRVELPTGAKPIAFTLLKKS